MLVCQQIEVNLIQGHQNVFFGFKRGTKGYILLNIQSRETFMSRDVVFYEHVFHIKGLKILAMKLTVQIFMIKIFLQKINLF